MRSDLQSVSIVEILVSLISFRLLFLKPSLLWTIFESKGGTSQCLSF